MNILKVVRNQYIELNAHSSWGNWIALVKVGRHVFKVCR